LGEGTSKTDSGSASVREKKKKAVGRTRRGAKKRRIITEFVSTLMVGDKREEGRLGKGGETEPNGGKKKNQPLNEQWKPDGG